MIIIEYINSANIEVYFPQFEYTCVKQTYSNFKNGTIKCPYEPRMEGVGYLGEGKYKGSIKNVQTKCYKAWHNMLRRCYNSSMHVNQPTYEGCTVCEEWYNFQNYARWYEENYYEVGSERMQVDKDILYKGNKIYSPETCVFVPQSINELFVKREMGRGDYPIGVSYREDTRKYQAQCNNVCKKSVDLGKFNDPIEAFNEYKRFKELTIKKKADLYKDIIPSKLYNAMYKYEVEITD